LQATTTQNEAEGENFATDAILAQIKELVGDEDMAIPNVLAY